jgi:hypothetical protein
MKCAVAKNDTLLQEREGRKVAELMRFRSENPAIWIARGTFVLRYYCGRFFSRGGVQ